MKVKVSGRKRYESFSLKIQSTCLVAPGSHLYHLKKGECSEKDGIFGFEGRLIGQGGKLKCIDFSKSAKCIGKVAELAQ